jgi:hypothetical protein
MPKKQHSPREAVPYSRLRPKKFASPEEFLAKLPITQRRIADALRSIIRRAVGNVREVVKTERKMLGYHAPHYFCFLFPRGDKVHLGFEWGDRLSDPKKRLQGESDYSQVRYLSFGNVKEIEPKELASMIREAASPTIKGSSKIRPVGQRPGGVKADDKSRKR